MNAEGTRWGGDRHGLSGCMQMRNQSSKTPWPELITWTNCGPLDYTCALLQRAPRSRGPWLNQKYPPPSTSTITHCASEGDLQPCGPDHADGGRGTEACDTEASDMCTNKTIARFGKNLGRNFIGRFGNIAHFNDLAASVGGTTKCAIVFSEVPEKSEVSDSFVLGDIGHFISHTSCEGRVNRPRCRRSQCRRPPERPCASTTSTVR